MREQIYAYIKTDENHMKHRHINKHIQKHVKTIHIKTQSSS